MLTFYTNPQSRGRIVRWMLEEVGQPYDTVVLDYGPAMNSPDYLAINPMGKVPAVVKEGHVVTECAAICAWLAEAYPEAGLQGDDRASFLRWMFFAAGPLEAAVTNRALEVVVPPGKSGFVGYGSFERAVDTLEGALEGHDWLGGSAFSAVDLYVGAQVIWGLQFGTLPDRPAFLAWRDRLVARPAYIRATALDDALVAKA
ncbi:glutathione S-transferase family protein [Szabonella alba]|uniref:Glutathione S-transferase family protein n=1 Tax=Szabonella alba TaxID=2804194 RepID=A0A8K0V9X3_9RHOB|nr:glutathione S-transferase family protein [Szabonella alba]MBL4915944.1 glutathione S-transferase family protein [Szabonella alba]